MALSNKFRRLALLMEPDVQRMLERHAQRTAGNDSVRLDERSGIASYQRGGALLWQPRAEKIGEWSHELALFRWYWAGVKFGEGPHRRLDVVHREGESYGLLELTTDTINIESAPDADLVAFLAGQLARADGVLRAAQPDRVLYYALYDSKLSEAPRGELLRDTAVTSGSERPAWMASESKAYSVAPPAGHNMTSLRPGGARSMPALVEVSADDGFDIPPAPRTPLIQTPPPPPPLLLPVREPAREIFMPVAQTALGDLAASLPGFAQAMVVLRVDSANGKGRFFVQLVAVDPNGDLISLDPSRALLEAAAKMIADDARDGNGRWHKLAARLRPTARGASVDLDVT